MPELFVRDIPQAVLRRLDARAADAGQSRAAWLREQLVLLAEREVTPVVRERYRLVCSGPGDATAIIRRSCDSEGSSSVRTCCSQEQAEAVRQARLLVEQNGPGDRERAIAALQSAFAEVLEGAG